MSRRTVWFSCGAASAVAAKITISAHDNVNVVYCDVMSDEHPDNERFFNDVQAWIGQPITRVQSSKYAGVDDVIESRRYMAGVQGALCTVELKKKPRFAYQQADDIHIFGFTADELARVARFESSNPELFVEWPLIANEVTKRRCFEIISEAGIALPEMYALGYRNNNCLGCVKATSAKYWNMVRRDFPETFTKRAEQSRKLGVRLTRIQGVRSFLDELPADYLPAGELEDISCGPDCQLAFPSDVSQPPPEGTKQ